MDNQAINQSSKVTSSLLELLVAAKNKTMNKHTYKVTSSLLELLVAAKK